MDGFSCYSMPIRTVIELVAMDDEVTDAKHALSEDAEDTETPAANTITQAPFVLAVQYHGSLGVNLFVDVEQRDPRFLFAVGVMFGKAEAFLLLDVALNAKTQLVHCVPDFPR